MSPVPPLPSNTYVKAGYNFDKWTKYEISFDYDDDNNYSTQSVEVINIPVVEYSNLVIIN